MAEAAQTAGRLFTVERMSEPELLPFAEGSAAVFSTASPERTDDNEDGAGLIEAGPERGVLAVADGLGGQPAGASASEVALRCLRELIECPLDPDKPLRSSILDGVEKANESVLGLGTGAATTLAAVEIDGATLRPYHVGDSAILVVGQRGKVKLQTVSHSPVGYGVEAGLIDEHDALHHDDRHLISNMVGSADMRIEVGSRFDLARRDTVLLATDGLFDNLNLAEVVDIIRRRSLATVSRTLVESCARRMASPESGHPSKPDDLTFILYRAGQRRNRD